MLDWHVRQLSTQFTYLTPPTPSTHTRMTQLKKVFHPRGIPHQNHQSSYHIASHATLPTPIPNHPLTQPRPATSLALPSSHSHVPDTHIPDMSIQCYPPISHIIKPKPSGFSYPAGEGRGRGGTYTAAGTSAARAGAAAGAGGAGAGIHFFLSLLFEEKFWV